MSAADYQDLSPDMILDAIESLGIVCDASILALNSYENRVFQIGLEEKLNEQKFLIAKFYRPKRWSDEQILEEHHFAFQLEQQEIPVVAPLIINDQSLFHFQGFRFALFKRVGGYSPEPGNFEQLERLGALLGRIHQCGKSLPFQFRDTLSIKRNLIKPKQFLIDNDFMPVHLLDNYQEITSVLEEKIIGQCRNFENINFINCHGDWHLGNILWRDESGGHIVDLDDCISGPAIQDIWMMLSGEPEEQAIQLQHILKGYEAFCAFNVSEVKLIESLRTMRIIYYCAWLAQRWEDPAFPKNFPWFDSNAFWQQHLRELQDQIPLIESNLYDLLQ